MEERELKEYDFKGEAMSLFRENSWVAGTIVCCVCSYEKFNQQGISHRGH